MRSADQGAVKAGKIYQQLRDAILSGRYEPGTFLRERNLAAKFQVSRTPVREALRQLERDGQVRLTPHVGAEVKDVSIQDLFEVLEMRRCLEPYAARLAALRMTPAMEANLQGMRKIFEDALARQPVPASIRRLIAADRRLHSLILNAAGNRRIARAITDVSLSIQRYRYFGISHRFRRNTQEHLDLITALVRRDAAATETAMARHLDEFTGDMRRLLLPGGGAHAEQ